jgi:hypothetical protein
VNEVLSHQIAERARAESTAEIAQLQTLLARKDEEAKSRLAAEIKKVEQLAQEKAKLHSHSNSRPQEPVD